MQFYSGTDYFELEVNGMQYRIEMDETSGMFTFTFEHSVELHSSQFHYLERSEKLFQLPNIIISKDHPGLLSWMRYSYDDETGDREECIDCVDVTSTDIGDILDNWVNFGYDGARE